MKDVSKQLFIENNEQWIADFNGFDTDKELKIRAFNNAIILPLKHETDIIPDGNINKYYGGVCSENFGFIAGSQVGKKSFCCDNCYSVDKNEIITCDEEVVFGGVFYEHFGVMLLQSLTRLWYLAENGYHGEKIVFLVQKRLNDNAKLFCSQMAEFIGITNIEIVLKPTKYKSVIIPEESYIQRKYITPKHFEIFDFIAGKANRGYKQKHSKVYLSRTRFHRLYNATDCQNEEFYENFYKKRGYHIRHPQELTLKEQIQIISNADEVVSTYGTLAHLATLFMKDNANQTMLLRSEKKNNWFCAQAQLLSVKNIRWNVIEAAKNPLPTWHDGGVFLLCPTKHFEKYLRDNNIEFSEKELKTEIPDKAISNFFLLWARVFHYPEMFKKLERPDLFPTLQAYYYQLTGKMLNQDDYI